MGSMKSRVLFIFSFNGMRKGRLFIEIIVLFTGLALAAFLIELKYRSFKTPADYMFDKYNTIKQKPFAVIIGNSHMGDFEQYSPDPAAAQLNLSIGGQDLFREYVVLRKIIKESKGKVKSVLLGLDYDVMGYNQVLSGQDYIDKQYFVHVDTLYKNSIQNRFLSSSAFFRSNREMGFLF